MSHEARGARRSRAGAVGRAAARLALAALLVPLAGGGTAPAAAATAPVPAAAAAGAPLPPRVVLRAPTEVRVGDAVRLEVVLDRLEGAAGYQVGLRHRPGAFTLAGVRAPSARLSPAGGTLVQVSPVERPDGVAVAAWSCTSAPCLAAAPPAAAGGPHVLHVELVAQRAGRADLALEPVLVVGPDGRQLPVRVPQPVTTVTVRSASGDASEHLAVPPAPRPDQVPPRRAPRTVDLTGDRAVGLQDVHDVEVAWNAAVSRAGACAPSAVPPGSQGDADGNGCLDVRDLQAFAGAAVPERRGATARSGAGAGPTTAAATTAAITAATTAAITAATTADTAAPAPVVLTVTSTGDEPDASADGQCRTAAGTCTLRAAIGESKRQSSTPVTIRFALPGDGPHVLRPATRLPSLTNPAGVLVDGYSQPGSRPNTSATASDAVLAVEVVGQGPDGIDGFMITSSGNVLRGLSVHGFQHNVWLYGAGATGNRVVGSFVGTDPTGTRAAAFDRPGASGVNVQGGAARNRVGGPDPADRNVLSGNYQHGVAMYDSTTTGNLVQGNLIGTTPRGDAPLPNRHHGVDINTWTTDTLIGGRGDGEGNVSSGNLGEGIEISHGPGTVRNDVIGNAVGTDATRAAAPAWAGNGQSGVRLEGHGQCSPCPDDAGESLVADNLVVGNRQGGLLTDKGFHDSVVRDNRIGVLPDGTPAGNARFGVRMAHGAQRFTIGPGNVIAHNAAGVQVDGLGIQPFDPASEPTSGHRIVGNVLRANGPAPAVDLTPLGRPNSPTATDPTINDGMLAPALTEVTAGAVSGTTCPGCGVEVFTSAAPAGQPGSGDRLVSAATADARGAFTAPLDAAAQGGVVTAAATNAAGSTSEFAPGQPAPRAAPGNLAPTAVAAASCSRLRCTFDAGGSSDPDGTVVVWRWEFGDGTTGTGSQVAHDYARSGTYDVRLVVVDGDGATGSTTTSVSPYDEPPVARAGSSCTWLECRFDGTGSRDPDGTVTAWEWDFGDGTTGTGATPAHAYAAAGTYAVRLTVRDDAGGTGSTTTTVVVSAAPSGTLAADAFARSTAPGWGRADVGGAYAYGNGTGGMSVDGATGRAVVAAGSTRSATLAGTAQRDVDVAVTVGLDRVAGGNGSSAFLTSRVVSGASYRSRLRFSSGGSGYLAAYRAVGGPEVAIGAEVRVPGLALAPGSRYRLRTQVTGAAPTTLRLKAWPVGTAEPDWQLVRTDAEPALQAAGGVGVSAYVSSSATNGPVTFSFDDLTATAGSTPPTASATFTCSSRRCSYDATSSSDAEGPITAYRWDFGDGTTSDSATGTHRYPDLAPREVTLTVTDAQGATATWTRSVVLTNTAPTAGAGLSCTELTCSADGAGSGDPDGGSLTYAWDWGDGTTTTGPTAEHAYAAPGEFAVLLTVTDEDGATATATRTAVLQAARPPVAALAVRCTGLICELDGAGSTAEGGVTGWSWDLGDGTTAQGRVVSHAYEVAGSYPVRLVVTDDRGASGQARGTAVPVPAPNASPELAADAFARTVASGGWGRADAGGAWTPAGSSAAFSVQDGSGRITHTAPGTSRSIALLQPSSTDTDSAVTVSFDAPPTGSGSYARVIGRRTGPDQEYRARLRVSGTRGYLSLQTLDGSSTEVALAADVPVPGLAHAAGTPVRLRLQVVGTAPTLLRAKAWPAAEPEPAAWTLTRSDDRPRLQAAGGLGLQSQLSSSSTGAPVTTRFTDYVVQRTDTPPTAALAVSCTGLECAADAGGSGDAQGSVSTRVSWGDGTVGTGPQATHRYAAAGTYTVSVTATDAGGLTAYEQRTVVVEP